MAKKMSSGFTGANTAQSGEAESEIQSKNKKALAKLEAFTQEFASTIADNPQVDPGFFDPNLVKKPKDEVKEYTQKTFEKITGPESFDRAVEKKMKRLSDDKPVKTEVYKTYTIKVYPYDNQFIAFYLLHGQQVGPTADTAMKKAKKAIDELPPQKV